MARKLRVQYPGAIYHVLNRGDRREPIFRTDADRVLFIDTLAEACQKTGWQVHALCLMHNHFHLVVETPNANLVAGMKWFLGTYTARFNRRHKLFGHLFSGRVTNLWWWMAAARVISRRCATTCISIPCGPDCWRRDRSSGVIVGAVTRRICCRDANGLVGCEWIDCWGNTDCPATPRRDGESLPCGWKHGGASELDQGMENPSVAVGVGEERSFARSYWLMCANELDPITAEKNGGKARKRGPNKW